MKSRTRDPDAKRRRIAAAALEIFGEHGYEGTTTAALAKAAGVAEGTVFHHFGSKDGLLEACGEEQIRPLAEKLLRGAGGAAPLDYRMLVERTFSWVAGNAHLGRLWAQADLRLQAPLTRGVRTALIAPLVPALEREQAAGRVRPGDCRALASFGFAIVNAALVSYYGGETRLSRKQVIEEAVRVLSAIVAPSETDDIR